MEQENPFLGAAAFIANRFLRPRFEAVL